MSEWRRWGGGGAIYTPRRSYSSNEKDGAEGAERRERPGDKIDSLACVTHQWHQTNRQSDFMLWPGIAMATDPAAMITLPTLIRGLKFTNVCIYIYIRTDMRTPPPEVASLFSSFEIVPVESGSLSTRTRQKRSEGEGTSSEAWRSAEEERGGGRG